ncbi:MAG: ATP synthase subunit I [Blautia sp.]|nr:ATP synthase subunit I [Blautia sp.]MDD7729440.1 ATP synthase subunit I [Clostridia bacterium]MDY5663508.1 ATP synthase subunit I [Blautia sp.]
MSSIFADIQPAVRKETRHVAIGTGICVVLMWVVFAILHAVTPEQIPFDYTVILGGLGGGIIAVLNFFLMGLTVQKVVSLEDEGQARNKMKASYSQRMLLQLLWGIAAIAAPCFQFAAGLLPLLFPNIVIKTMGILGTKKQPSSEK